MSLLYTRYPRLFRITAALILSSFLGVCAVALSVVQGVRKDISVASHYDFTNASESSWQPHVVGTHPRGDNPWFLVLGDSISGGITPTSLISGQNNSWVIPLKAKLSSAGDLWDADVLACSGENTQTYYTGCPMAIANPLLGGHPQHDVALQDIHAHLSSLKFIVVELGANDLFGLKDDASYEQGMQGVVSRLQKIVEELRTAAPNTPLLIADVYNPFAADQNSYATQLDYLNTLIGALASTEHATMIDFAHAILPTDAPNIKEQLCRLLDCAHQDIHPTRAGALALATASFDALFSADVLPPPDTTAPPAS